MQTCPGFFLKSLLESLGNHLEICSVNFVDTLYVAPERGVKYCDECVRFFISFVHVACGHILVLLCRCCDTSCILSVLWMMSCFHVIALRCIVCIPNQRGTQPPWQSRFKPKNVHCIVVIAASSLQLSQIWRPFDLLAIWPYLSVVRRLK